MASSEQNPIKSGTGLKVPSAIDSYINFVMKASSTSGSTTGAKKKPSKIWALPIRSSYER